MRVEGEVGVQLDTQDFRGSVQRVTSSPIRNNLLLVKPGLAGIRGERCIFEGQRPVA